MLFVLFVKWFFVREHLFSSFSKFIGDTVCVVFVSVLFTVDISD